LFSWFGSHALVILSATQSTIQDQNGKLSSFPLILHEKTRNIFGLRIKATCLWSFWHRWSWFSGETEIHYWNSWKWIDSLLILSCYDKQNEI
jgi:hypothetical protein